VKSPDLEEMPALLRQYLLSLQSNEMLGGRNTAQEELHPRYLSVDDLEHGLLTTDITQENNLTLGHRGFGVYGQYWVISAARYID